MATKAKMRPGAFPNLSARAHETYDRYVRPHLKKKDKGRFVSLDIDTGVYEIGDDAMAPALLMRERYPTSELFLFRVGYLAAHTIGGANSPDPKWKFK